MKIRINGNEVDVQSQTLSSILAETGFDKPFVATAVNGTFVRKEIREQTRIREADRIEIVAPLEGG